MRLPRALLLGILLLGSALLLSACGTPAINRPETAPNTPALTFTMPEYVVAAGGTTEIAYNYAVTHPQELETIPCYCGCSRMGHRDNLGCYVKSIHPDGTVEFDNHAAFCAVCIDITLDVKRLTEAGKSRMQIRMYIDSEYSQYGPSTDTKMPPE